MDHFSYKNGELYAEGVPVRDIIDAVGTPFYCYSTATIQRHYKVFADSLEGLDTLVCYAMKANGNLAVLKTLGDMGAGADVVSSGEMDRALAAGIPADRIVFSGVGKTAEELSAAVDAGIMQINVESEPELEALSAIASAKDRHVTVSIRVNPDVDAKTHEKITTGKSENKFGIDIGRAREVFSHAASLPGISPVGIAMHIGSQLRDLKPFREAYENGVTLVEQLRSDGHTIDRIDLGGGLGIPYFEDEGESPPPSPEEYGTMVKAVVGNLGCKVMLEPGRVIMGNAGILVSKVVYVKQGPSRRFIILDAAMNDLIRPSFYNAHHAIMPVAEPAVDAAYEEADVVGPICESGDTFAKQRPMPPLNDGDAIAFKSAGAYGAVMSSFYNARPLVPEVLVTGDKFAVVRRRIEVSDMMAFESMPDWLEGSG
ncbi:MAG: diaminopimelate decarboxylase [Rhodospirillales bacterium]|jgi:diaminopimelate decarboxylase|nr:diaminopimelate decarboxylase [Rhodospirillales bacterium]MBT4039023.1 diaminopimelate decarboxylase [Rhodospirillales bacterium]MBT4628053.1 diaminopimelate decarboxylase [Rhodospirillales bacterium]MBT5352571.1 diaminopimelate decarboxylase [Rhodospirillales bacterium]MBT5520899.1 diaminopimelate decarboxylase [Rhodospirillales bacterium]